LAKKYRRKKKGKKEEEGLLGWKEPIHRSKRKNIREKTGFD